MNHTGLELLKDLEGCKLTSYKDSIGVWTIGYGHTRGIHGTVTCTQEQADAWLKSDIDEVEGFLEHLIKVKTTENQFAALVILVFNIGVGAFRTSTLLRMLNDGYADTAANEFPRWNKAGGRVCPGLVARREREQALFLTS